MKINARRLSLAGLAGIAAGAVVLAVSLSGTTLTTPALSFVAEMWSQTYLESFKINAHADDDGTGTHNVKIVARDPSDMFVVRNTVAPGGYSGWHTHPGPSVVSVTAGTATVYSGTDPSRAGGTYSAGMGFIDEGGGHVHMVRNQGAVPLVLVAFQIVPHGVARRQDAPDPGFCPF